MGKFSAAFEDAWSDSIFGQFPDRPAEAVLGSAVERRIKAGTIIYREQPMQGKAMAAIVATGLLRTYIASPEGRQVTLRYARSGDIIGLLSVISGGASARVEAVTDSTYVVFNVEVLRHLIKRDATVASLVAKDLARSLQVVQGMLAENVFGTVRERVQRHLLDLATRDPDGVLRVHVSQQEVADAIGSVREVVSRVLASLRAAQTISRDPSGSITLIDPSALHAVAQRDQAVWQMA